MDKMIVRVYEWCTYVLDWVLDLVTFIYIEKILGHQKQGNHELELGIGLGNIRWFMENDHQGL